jgi:hypothetical protein
MHVTPLHEIWPVVQHLPLVHSWPPPHAVPHAPQFASSVSVFVHEVPLQFRMGSPAQQMPLSQTSSLPEQITPPAPAQPPQFASSLSGSTHALPHQIWPSAQQ